MYVRIKTRQLKSNLISKTTRSLFANLIQHLKLTDQYLWILSNIQNYQITVCRFNAPSNNYPFSVCKSNPTTKNCPFSARITRSLFAHILVPMSRASARENWPWAGTTRASVPGYRAERADNFSRTLSRIDLFSEKRYLINFYRKIRYLLVGFSLRYYWLYIWKLSESRHSWTWWNKSYYYCYFYVFKVNLGDRKFFFFSTWFSSLLGRDLKRFLE